ncbi:MAG: cation-translocating P-type ATPase [Planctomyces sp.]|nr:cation-translocating P-type ATPase [Planctomyces sp.]
MSTDANDPVKSLVGKHSLVDHEGIVGVHRDDGTDSVQIEFDPERLSEQQVRELVDEHAAEMSAALRKFAFRLDGAGSEAVAQKLERRVREIPGVRRATATYLGRVLCLTFDTKAAPDAQVLEQVRRTGASVQPLEEAHRSERNQTWRDRLLGGQLNEELACFGGLIFLAAGLTAELRGGLSATAIVLYVVAYALSGFQGVVSAIASLREKVLDVDVLMVLAAIGAAIVGAPFEGALLLFLFSLSNVLQRYAMERTQKAIESLLTLRPEQALVRRGKSTELVAVEILQPGDIVVVRPGEHIPVDGVVSEGSSSVNESSLTGESMPVSKSAGSTIFAGTLNQSGGLDIRVTRRAEDSTLSRMVKLVAEAQAEKSGTQRFLEEAEQYYATGVIVLTFVVFIIPWTILGQAFEEAFYRAMTIMVVASPCALVISTPATVLSAIGGAARKGVLIKGGSHLERAAHIDIVTVDKTGTLTLGRPALTEFVTRSGIHVINSAMPEEAKHLLKAVAALESRSEHPLATAIVKGAQQADLTLPNAIDFQSTTGKGAEATVDGIRYLVGSERLMREIDAGKRDELAALARPLQAKGKTCVWLAIRTSEGVTAQAVLVMADVLRTEASRMVRDLHAAGVKKVVMLTGDHKTVAKAIADEAGIDEVHAELLPEDKVAVIRQLRQEGRVMMIGDGVNDAPALAVSDLGVAMGAAGTDIAMETADVVLMGDKLENIAGLLRLARRARRILLQNLIFSGSVIVVLIAAALGFELPLPLGVIGHEGSTVLVCLNGLRLLFPPKNFAS